MVGDHHDARRCARTRLVDQVAVRGIELGEPPDVGERRRALGRNGHRLRHDP
jgi:hypothetical protein